MEENIENSKVFKKSSDIDLLITKHIENLDLDEGIKLFEKQI